MRRRLLLVTTLLVGWNLLSARSLPGRKKTLEALVKVSNYFMKKYADFTQPSYVGKFKPSSIWTRGVYYERLMALRTVYPRSDYYGYAYDWADFYKWGLRDGNITRNADGHCCGQAYIELYRIPPDPARTKNIKVSIDILINTPQVDGWAWVDVIQTGMPVLVQLDRLTDEQKYYDKMWQMYSYPRNKIDNGLFDQKEGL